MPPALTIFAAQYLVFIDAAIAAIVLALLLYRRPRPQVVRWVVAGAIVVVLSYVFAKIGGSLYSDPRPFTVDHVKPLTSHGADNGFPSDHALLAAVVVALVALVSPWLALPFAVIAVLVDLGRVGSGLHHVSDVVGSDVLVTIATVIALLVTPPLAGWVVGAKSKSPLVTRGTDDPAG